MRLSIFIFLFTALLSSAALATAPPVLFFSDIISGPKTGLGDGLGDGAIVTVWGRNLGSTQETSKIYCNGAEASHVYYWENADPENGDSGPADLYTYHKMQEIAFSISASAVDGTGKIKVVVGGIDSNTLDFMVRSGHIYYVAPDGNNNNDGSWPHPWADAAGFGAISKMQAGDITYFKDGYVAASGINPNQKKGSKFNSFAMVAYPGADILATNTSYWTIGPHSQSSTYWDFCKWKVTSSGNAINTFKGGRVIANDITNIPGGCADGQGGAISGSGRDGEGEMISNVKIFGNYVHDWGCDASSKLHHVFYMSNRSGVPVEMWEIGWNFLLNCKTTHGIHNYDEGVCGDGTGIYRVHDNVVVNQRGTGISHSGPQDGSGTDPCMSYPIEIYNNLLINCGQGSGWQDSGGNSVPFWATSISLGGSTNHSHVKIFNNTIIGNGDAVNRYSEGNASIYIPSSYGGEVEIRNNIIVDTKNYPFINSNTPTGNFIMDHNLYYDQGGNEHTPPAQDTAPLMGNPMFTSSTDYTIQSTSPARDSGDSIVSETVQKDMLGLTRQAPYDIGAFEYFAQGPNIINIILH